MVKRRKYRAPAAKRRLLPEPRAADFVCGPVDRSIFCSGLNKTLLGSWVNFSPKDFACVSIQSGKNRIVRLSSIWVGPRVHALWRDNGGWSLQCKKALGSG